MTRLRIILILAFCALAWPRALLAQPQAVWEIQPRSEEGWVQYDIRTGIALGTNGVMVTYGGAVLTADRVTVNKETGEVVADGQVRVQREDQVWVSEHMRYNFKTKLIEAGQFRTGKSPVFASGEGLHGELTNSIYAATNAWVSNDDIAEPAMKIRAKYVRIIPGQKIIAREATLYVGDVPVFYFPYYSRNMGPRANNFNFVPGYRSSYGAYLLTSYNWFLTDTLDGTLHVDMRSRRGVGLGPDVNWRIGRWGEASLKYYYLHDEDPEADVAHAQIPANRQRVDFSYLGMPFTNVTVLSRVRYQGDTNLIREFFEGEYRQNPQPNTFFDVNKFWQNFSLDTYVQPRVNDFLETVERLPDVRLTGFRQQIGTSPLFYESESSVGYYRRLFAETNSVPLAPEYSATRADTYHQITLPQTYFGWLNVTPRVGGRFTYYGDASGPGSLWDEETRGVFNTGAEVSFKASQLWPNTQNRFFEVDGLRHIIQPSVNYVYVPEPNVRSNQLPQFDYEMPSLRLLPIEYPDYNAIDSIDSQNVIRLGLGNRLQTKRQGNVVNLVNWDLYTDWRLQQRANQTKFADTYSDLVTRPWSWLTAESLTRFDVEDGVWRMALHSVTLQPNTSLGWTIGHFYLHDDDLSPATGLGEGNSLLFSTIFVRLNENWGLRASHRFEARTGDLQEQAYSIYRDLRFWTVALTVRLRDNTSGNDDVTVAFTFSLKAFPRSGLGTDVIRPYSLWGY